MVLMEFIEPRPRYLFNRNSAVLGHPQNIGKTTLLLRALCNLDLENLSAPGAQSFIDGVAGIDEFFHEGRFYLRNKNFRYFSEVFYYFNRCLISSCAF